MVPANMFFYQPFFTSFKITIAVIFLIAGLLIVTTVVIRHKTQLSRDSYKMITYTLLKKSAQVAKFKTLRHAVQILSLLYSFAFIIGSLRALYSSYYAQDFCYIFGFISIIIGLFLLIAAIILFKTPSRAKLSAKEHDIFCQLQRRNFLIRSIFNVI